MVKSTIKFKKWHHLSLAKRIFLVFVWLIFSVNTAKSQQAGNCGNSLHGKTGGLGKTEYTLQTHIDESFGSNNGEVSQQPQFYLADPNDPDYEAKKEQWVNDHPEEYGLEEIATGKSKNRMAAGIDFDAITSVLDYGKGGIYEGRSPANEVISLRDLTSKHFLNADGTIDAVITAGMPLNFQEGGEWKTIRKEILPNNTASHQEFPFCNISNTTKTYYADKSTAGVLTEYGGKVVLEWFSPRISWMVNGTISGGIDVIASDAQVDINKIVYQNCFPGTDVRFIQENGGKKHDIIINSKEILSNAPAGASHLAIQETVILPDGWSYKTKDSFIYIINSSGESMFAYSDPVYYDAGKKKDMHIGDYEIQQNGNELLITSFIPMSWLSSNKRVFPITIDPDATIYATSGGYQGSSGIYSDDVAIMICGYYSGGPAIQRAWGKFNTSTINDGASISAVSLCLVNDIDFGGAETISTWSTETYYGPYGAYNLNNYNDIGAGTNYNSYSVDANGSYGPTSLGTTAASHLQAQLANDRFQVGLTSSNTSGSDNRKRFNGSSYIVTTYATSLACGNTNLGAISPATCSPANASYTSGTIPYWSFTATAGYSYHFSMDQNTEDSYLRLYDAGMTQIAYDDDGGYSTRAFLNWTCTTSGTYYVSASHYSCNALSNSGTMAYWSTDDASYGSGSGNTITPTPVWQNQAYTAGSFYYYYVSATAGVNYNFSLCSNTEDSYMRIYNSSFSLITTADDNGPSCSGAAASINWLCSTSGIYIVAVNNWSCDAFINGGNLAYRISPCVTQDHGGADWTVSASTSVGGTHTNIGTFTINSGVTASVDVECHYFYIEANNIVISGTIDANGVGYSGGAGGAYGGLWAQDGSTDGRGITSCWDKDNCKSLGQDGGSYGSAGSGPGGGGSSTSGGRGYGSKQDCGAFGDDGGMVGGGGGAGGGAGGTYGGAGGAGKIGGQGGSDDNQCGNSNCQTYIEGAGGAGGTASSVYGSASTETIEYGSGGAGAGGGGRGSFCYSHTAPHTCYSAGESGGAGGGSVKLVANQNLTINSSGSIYANGANGGAGGEGGENDYSADCCEDLSGGCDEQTYSAPGGGGSGAGGGSGGGIMLKADCSITMNGTLQANGGNGGTGGNGGYSDWSTAYYGGKGSGGAGGGGGRIKIFRNLCGSNTIAGSITVNGGSGGAVATLGRAGTGTVGNVGTGGSYTINTSSTAVALTAGAIGSDHSICSGGDPNALTNITSPSLATCSPSLAYQWMSCTSGCTAPPTGYSVIAGATGDTYDPPAGMSQTTYYVRRVTSGTCTAYSNNITVTTVPNNSITLAAGGTQTQCINTALTTTTYSTTGASGAAITGLPAGVNGSWASNTVTISGTPTATGTFVYTVTLAGGCGTSTANGTITVLPNNTLTLVSGANQTQCINTAISPLTYSTSGATGATYSGLPAGVSGTFASNTVTISGTPTVTGTFTFTINLTGGCGTASTTSSITVTPNNTVSLSSAAGTNAQTKCINTAITNITYATIGATGATVSGLPSGINGSWSSNTVTISGSSLVSGTYTYTVTTTGGCGTASSTGTLTVTPVNTVSLSSSAGTNAQTKCINTTITNITYSTSGATGATFSGLPAGVSGSWASNTVTISGAPTASGIFTYTVSLSGGCGLASTTGTINVTPANTISLISGGSQTMCINTAITTNVYSTSGATGATFTGLPSGVSGNWSSGVVTVNGTPTVAGTYTYTVALTGGCGSVSTNHTLTVVPNNTLTLSSAVGTNNQNVCNNTAISPITYASTVATGATITGLPAGVTGNWSSNMVTISGTPTVPGTYTYTVALTGGCGVVSSTGTLTVLPVNTITLTAGGTQTKCINTAINTTTYTTTGATGAVVSGLPSGVSGSWASNVVTISGTPSVTGTFTYTVALPGGCGTSSASGLITVTPDNTVSLSSAAGTNAQTMCINTAITNITYATSGATGATVSGLPSGVAGNWSSNMVTISGTPSVAGNYTFTVALIGGCGTVTSTGLIEVIPANTISLSAGGTQTKCINTALTTTTYTSTGATGATISGLPAGVTGSWASNVVTISGTPTVPGDFTYTITLTGGCATVSANGTITVNPDNALALSSSAGSDVQNVCKNSTITTITYNSAIATGAIVSGLPLGVTGNWASNVVTISGSPTVSGTYHYTVTTTGGCQTAIATGSIIVKENKVADLTLQAFDNPTCSHSPVSFTASAVNGGTTPMYEWFRNGNPVGTNSSTYTNISLANGDVVICKLTSNEFCAINNPAYDTVTMIVSGIPITEAGNKATFTGTPVHIGDSTNGPGSIVWAPATGLNNNWLARPLASPSVTTQYTLTINNNGCIRTDTVTVVFGGYARIISGKTRYIGKAVAGNPAPNLPSYSAAKYNIPQVIVKLLSYPGGVELARDTSDALGMYQINNVFDGSYILSYDKYTIDTMQSGNDINAVDVALVKYLVGHDTTTDPSRSFSAKYKRAANNDNNNLINAVDIARLKSKIGSPYDPTKNFPKGNWVSFDTVVTVAGANLTVALKTICYGDYDASSSKYKDSLTTWSQAKVLPEENIIIRSDETIITSDRGYFEIPLRISAKMNDFSALGLELVYPDGQYQLVRAVMPNVIKKTGHVKINPSFDEILASDNDLLVTDHEGVVRVVYATTDHFDVVSNDEVILLGFQSKGTLSHGELDFSLEGTGVIADQYGAENPNAYLIMPKIFVQGDNQETGFDFAGYPNPFSGNVNLTYDIPVDGNVKLNVYNAIGELVSELVNKQQVSGKHTVVFASGNLPAGLYTFKLEYNSNDESKCIVLKMIH